MVGGPGLPGIAPGYCCRAAAAAAATTTVAANCGVSTLEFTVNNYHLSGTNQIFL